MRPFAEVASLFQAVEGENPSNTMTVILWEILRKVIMKRSRNPKWYGQTKFLKHQLNAYGVHP